jgi:hypothetical protein
MVQQSLSFPPAVASSAASSAVASAALPLWRAVSSRSSEDHLRRCGLWIAGRGPAWAAAPDPHGLAHQLWLTGRWAPRRLVAAFCALDTALRAGGAALRAAVAPWIASLAAALQTAVPTAADAAFMEALAVTWVELGFVGPALLAVRWMPAPAAAAEESLASATPTAAVAAGGFAAVCKTCGAVFAAGGGAAAAFTFRAHVEAHGAARVHRTALAARRPSKLRDAAIAVAVCSAKEPDAAASPIPGPVPNQGSAALGRLHRTQPHSAHTCPVCGDTVQRCFDDVGNQWAWRGAVVSGASVVHVECMEAWTDAHMAHMA